MAEIAFLLAVYAIAVEKACAISRVGALGGFGLAITPSPHLPRSIPAAVAASSALGA